MNFDLFNALLSMDAYNRGYSASISALSDSTDGSVNIGAATLIDTKGDAAAQNIGFYAAAYDVAGAGTIIAYRGTDDYDGPGDLLTSKDVANGWLLGGGDYDAAQAWMALDFYNEVAGNPVDPRTASISLTGHSLGGGLAGYVASLYGKDALAFDSMAFLTGANLAHIRAVTATGDPAEQALQTRLLAEAYNGLTPWAVDDSGVTAQHIDGEILHATFVRQSPSTQIDMGNNVMGLDSVQLHSQSTLVIRKFADTEIGGATQWREAAKHFWPVLYNDTFAFSVGMNDPGLAGTLQTGGQYADILRMIIAYSAIDNGADSTNARPFGDTGIRAFYDDASDLGSALTASGSGSAIETYATEISGAFIHLAGQLALNKVLQSDAQGSLALTGILTYSDQVNNQTLTIDLSDPYWTLVTGSADHNAETPRFALVSSVLLGNGIGGEVLNQAAQIWGDGTFNAFDRVAFATQQSGTTIIAEPATHSDKATLFIGGSGNDTITGSSAGELIIGGAGDDVVNGGAGDDIYISGAGADTYQTSLGFDTLSYADDAAGITITGLSEVTDGSGAQDSIGWIENVIATPFDDEVALNTNSTFEPGRVYDGGNGTDKLIASISTVITAGEAYVDGAIIAKNFEVFQGGSYHILEMGNQYIGGSFDYSGYHTAITANFATGQISDGINTDTGVVAQFGFVGTNHGDTITMGGDSRVTLGQGNDVVHLSSNRNHYITYTGGNDVVKAAGTRGVEVLFMDRGFAPVDVSIQEINVVSQPSGLGAWDDVSFDLLVQVTGGGQMLIEDLSKQVSHSSGETTSTNAPQVVFADGQYYDEFYDLQPYNASNTGLRGNRYEHQGTAGNDNIDASTITHFGHIIGNAGDDTLTGDSTTTNINGGVGNDTINGGSGNENLFGQTGNDIINGADGNDRVSGGIGDDQLLGGAGIDTLYGGFGNDRLEGGAGNDFLYGGDLNTYDQDVDTAAFAGALQNYTVSQSGKSLFVFDTVGTGGNDFVREDIEYLDFNGLRIAASSFFLNQNYGTDGGETLDGTGASDLLIAFAGDDNVNGLAGDDVIYGGFGADTLSGGTGADQFVFESNSAFAALDTIADFSLAEGDKIDVSDVLIDYDPLNQAITDFVQITTNGTHSFLRIDPDGGGNNFVQVATISNTLGLGDEAALEASGNLITSIGFAAAAPGNSPPQALNDSFTGTEDTPVTGNVLADNGNGADSDPENHTLSVIAGTFTTAQGGSVTISTDGGFDYVPLTDFSGTDSFAYTVTDGNGGSDTGTVTVTLSAVNDPPVVTNNGAIVDEDTTLGLTTAMLSMADVESAPASRTFTLQSLPTQGTLYLNGVALALAAAFTQQDILDGLVTYTPGTNYNGADSFDVVASDGTASLPSETFSITITAVNDAPLAANDSFTGLENTALSGNLLADNGNGADSDPENHTLSVTAGTFTTAQGGSVTISTDGGFNYVPLTDFSGVDSFAYTLSDGYGGSDTGTATVTVGAVNASPALTNEGATINEDTALILTSAMLNATDADNTAAQLVFALNAIPANGDLLRNAVVLSVNDTFTMQDVLDGLISYQPEANHNGTAGVTFTVTDGETTLPAETFTITINAVNDAPVAADDAFSGTQDTQITGNLLSDNGNGADSDPENHTLSVTAGTFTTAQGGSITISTAGGFNYVPLANFNGTDSFAYTVTDGNGGSDTATVTFTVNPALNIINGTAANNTINGTSADDGIYGFAGQDDISGGDGNDVIEGGAGADKMRGEAGDDRIEDLSTDGLVDGYANWFWGGTGNDTMIGGTGNEIYYDGYGGAIGNLIEDAGGIEWYAHMAGGDRVRITDLGGLADKQAIAGNILTHANTTFARYLDSDLVIKNAAGSVHLIYTDQFTDLGNVTGIGVEEIFISGVWLNLKSHILNYAGVMVTRGSDADDVINGITIANTNDEIYAGAGADTVSGDAGDDLLYGELGDDLLNGGAGADTLSGGAGNDTLQGGADSDSYLFNPGDGHDTITDTGGASDGIHLGVGITQGQLIQTQVGDNLELTFSGNPADKITITNHFAIGGANLVEKVIFDDNSEISLVPPSAPPVLTNNGATINEDTALVLNSSLLSATDPDNTAAQLVFALSAIPANGDLLRNAVVLAVSDTFTMQDVLDGLISYQPEANHNGAASFAFTVTDGETTLPAATFNITINAVNDAPVAADDAFTGTQDTQITGNVLSDNGSGADSDPDGDPLTVTPTTITTGAGATVVLLATGSFTYTPAPGVTGVDNFIYTASDGNGGSDTATVTLTVNPNLNIINGTSANNVLTGTAAADGIYGLAGQDDISGGAGNDVIEGGAGADKMRGEAGDDHIEDLSTDGLVDGYANWFWGGTGNDTMLGGTGNDIYYDGYGSANANLIEDAGGIEWYAHMAGGDQVRITDLGGLADKQAIAGNILTHANTTFERYLDADLVIKNTAGTVHLIYTDQFTDLGNVTGIGVEEIFISAAWLNLKSHILNYAGVMVTRGSDADDVINGITIANTNDEIYAGAGNDTVSGDAGDDVLYGQDGLDQLWGGAGADIFGFEAASAFNDIDTIKDFSVAQGDAIDISDLLFGYDPLTDAITDFVTFTDNAGNSQMSIDRDGTGGAYSAVQVATIENVTGLDATTMETNNNLFAA